MEEDICLIGIVILTVIFELCGIIVKPQLVLISVVPEAKITIFIKWLAAVGNVPEFIGTVKESGHKLHFALDTDIILIRANYRFLRKRSCLCPLLVHSSKLTLGKLLRPFRCFVRGKTLDYRIFVIIGVR